MGSRKRGRDEMESSEPAPDRGLLQRIRDTWEFSNLMQYIFIFGKVVKIDEDLTIEVGPPCASLCPDDNNIVIPKTLERSSANAPPNIGP
jgi:hypothetical protein